MIVTALALMSGVLAVLPLPYYTATARTVANFVFSMRPLLWLYLYLCSCTILYSVQYSTVLGALPIPKHPIAGRIPKPRAISLRLQCKELGFLLHSDKIQSFSSRAQKLWELLERRSKTPWW